MTGGHTVLQVPVTELEPFVRQRHEHYDPDFVSADPAFVHAHITVLGPFLPPAAIDDQVLSTIDEIATAAGGFDYRLEQVDVFPNGVIHLVPDPVEPFRSLTAELFTAFPSCPPYGGAFPDVRPHLTLDARAEGTEGSGSTGSSGGVTVESTRRLLGSLVPAQCRAERLDLALWGNRTCRVLDSWALGRPQSALPCGGKRPSRPLLRPAPDQAVHASQRWRKRACAGSIAPGVLGPGWRVPVFPDASVPRQEAKSQLSTPHR